MDVTDITKVTDVINVINVINIIGKRRRTLCGRIMEARSLIPETTKFEEFLSQLDNIRSRLLDREITEQILDSETQNFHSIINAVAVTWSGSDAPIIVNEYIDRIHNPVYSYPAGYGFRITSLNGTSWVIRPAFYEICKPLPIEQLCMIIDNRKYEISEIAELVA